METEVLTVRIPADLLADLDDFAAHQFPTECLSCRGTGRDEHGAPCRPCGGSGAVASRTEATRYLLHFALGERSSPEARAMLAAYTDMRAFYFRVINRAIQRMEAAWTEEVIEQVQQMPMVELDEDEPDAP